MARSFQARAGPFAEIGERPGSSDAVGGSDARRAGSASSDAEHRARCHFARFRSKKKHTVLGCEVRALTIRGGAGQAQREAGPGEPQAYVERTPIFSW